MTASPTPHDLRRWHRAINDMLADPDVTGDLLLVGIWIARAVYLNEPGAGKYRISYMARDIFGPGRPGPTTILGETTTVPNHYVHAVRRALRDDTPRYDPMADNIKMTDTCAATMIRRAGKCGQHATRWHLLTDLGTGRSHALAACRRHHPWLDEQRLRNREQVRDLGDRLPIPPMNAGGVLARHIPLDWPRMWRKLNPDWAPPPEGTPVIKPQLRVLEFDDPELDDMDVEAEPEITQRPTLTVLDGGWR